MTNPSPPSASTRFIGWALIVMGGLMALLCGGCTLVMIGVAITSGTSAPTSLMLVGVMSIVLVLVIGGLPAAAGAALVWAGWRIVRPLPPAAAKVSETFE